MEFPNLIDAITASTNGKLMKIIQTSITDCMLFSRIDSFDNFNFKPFVIFVKLVVSD